MHIGKIPKCNNLSLSQQWYANTLPIFTAWWSNCGSNAGEYEFLFLIKTAWVKVASTSCLPIYASASSFAGKLPGIPRPDSAIELIASPAAATKLIEIIFFICFTLLLDLVKLLTTATILYPISPYHQTLKNRNGSET